MKVLIVGGVAGGASCAARLRRNDERAQIIMFERGEYISFANCGLPYYIGDVIKDKRRLTLQTPESFHARFNVDVRVQNEVIKIDRAAKTVTVRNLKDNTEYVEGYDKLVLSPGASPARPPIEGIDSERVFTLRDIPDTYRIKEFCASVRPKSALVIGGGYIGIEMAENLHNLGIEVTIVELTGHVIGAIDGDMAAELHNHIRSKGVRLILNDAVKRISEEGGSLKAELKSGLAVEADMAVLSTGVKPESRLAADAGLAIGETGGILVDQYLRTSDPDIYAVGDAVEVTDFVCGGKAHIPLASPANKQGRIAADNICGKSESYGGTQGSVIIKVFDLTVAATGVSEEHLLRSGVKYLKSFTYSASSAGYYPGGMPISIKLLFSPGSGRILGAQAVGYTGVDKRMDVIATAVRAGMSVADLEKLELCYAPPYSSAKDPVNMAGYVANNILKGEWKPFYPEDVHKIDLNSAVLLDVRTRPEFEGGTIKGAVNIPLDELRGRLGEIPRGKPVYIFCQIGLRGYIAARILMQSGFEDVKNLSGGYRLYSEIMRGSDGVMPAAAASSESAPAKAVKDKVIEVDACGLNCPGPIMEVFKAVSGAAEGDILAVRATDPAFANDVKAWCDRTGNTLLSAEFKGKYFEARIQKGGGQGCVPTQGGPSRGNAKSMVVFSGDLDKAIAAFIIANGAAAMGRRVNMFFTFWGLNILRKRERVKVKKDLISRMFGFMMPRGSLKLKLSKMNMGGIGGKMIRGIMRAKNIDSLEELIEKAKQNGVALIACNMSMDVMGIKKEELIDGVELGGVATFLSRAEESDATLFI